jgi:hypothetical protein
VTHRLLTSRWEAAERLRLRAWGLPNNRVKPLRVWLNPGHGPALAALPFDLVWASTWEQEANDFVAPLLGLPSLPFVAWSDPRPELADGVFWKTPQIVAWAKGRAFAWVDDQVTDADVAWVRTHHLVNVVVDLVEYQVEPEGYWVPSAAKSASVALAPVWAALGAVLWNLTCAMSPVK